MSDPNKLYCSKCGSSYTRNRIRNSKNQFSCRRCSIYFTENSSLPRLESRPEYLEFVSELLPQLEKKPKAINNLLKQYPKLPKSTIYKRKYVFMALVEIPEIFRRNLSLLSRSYAHTTLTIKLANPEGIPLKVIVYANMKDSLPKFVDITITFHRPSRLKSFYGDDKFSSLINSCEPPTISFKIETTKFNFQLNLIFGHLRNNYRRLFPIADNYMY